MLGKIVGIEENIIILKLSIDISKTMNIINLYLLIDDGKQKTIGEIVDIRDDYAYVNMLGEMINNEFVFGVLKKPSFGSVVSLIAKDSIHKIIGIDNYAENKDLKLGFSPIYEGVDIGVDINKYFSHHFAIFGSTGSGKSCSVARIIQNLFEKEKHIPYKASIFIFDAYGEYHSAFKDINKKVPEITFKAYTTNLNFPESEILRIPLWLMTLDDIALLLGAEKSSQLPIIEKALKLVSVFAREEELIIKHKNDIIARAILDILSSGRPPVQIRDQVFSILSYYNTSELNLETEIFQPGYTRPLKHILQVDNTGKIREMELIMNFFNTFLRDDLELSMPDGTFSYNLNDLKDAFDFALISEGILKSEKVYDDTNVLKVRLHSLANSATSEYFNYPEYVSKEQYIRNLLSATDGKKAQIINFNINYIDDRLAKTITKIYSKLLFDYAKELEDRATFPFHIILEEAHRYVQNDNDINLLGYNIFERITKEGRKYGVILGLISQRPSELSETTLSQCSNFLIFKMLHPRDVEYIREMVPNITNEVVKRLRILQPGTCIGFGSAFRVPSLIRFNMPDPAPTSSSCDVSGNWFIKRQ
jgi:DNA helicase HerA-like ATPase